MSKVTIRSVAKLANVSVGTASRILNGGTKGMRRDASERAEKIKQIAKKLGYEPNVIARGLALKRTFTIGLLATELDNPVRSHFIEILRQKANAKGYQLLVSGYSEKNALKDIKNLISRQIDGLLLCNLTYVTSAEYVVSVLNRNDKSEMPIVGFGDHCDNLMDNVFIDYSGMTAELTTHLINTHKCRNIVFAGYQPESRHNGYVRVMTESGLKKFINIWSKGHSLEDGAGLVSKYLDMDAIPDAIVCHNDVLAIGIIAGLRHKGFRVPEDIAVVGLDNIDMGKYMNPQLTTVGNNYESFAEIMLDLLLTRIEGNYSGRGRQVNLPWKSYFRESCGCCYAFGDNAEIELLEN